MHIDVRSFSLISSPCCQGSGRHVPFRCKRKGGAMHDNHATNGLSPLVLADASPKWSDKGSSIRRWHALFVRSNQEKRIAQQLASRGVECFVPTRSAISQWADRRVRLERPLFPGYVFVRVAPADRPRVLHISNVVGLVRAGTEPAVISCGEIEWIRRGIAYGKAEPCATWNEGEMVTITGGPMAGMRGVLLRVQNRARLLIRLDAIARAFTVDVEDSFVARIGA